MQHNTVKFKSKTSSHQHYSENTNMYLPRGRVAVAVGVGASLNTLSISVARSLLTLLRQGAVERFDETEVLLGSRWNARSMGANLEEVGRIIIEEELGTGSIIGLFTRGTHVTVSLEKV